MQLHGNTHQERWKETLFEVRLKVSVRSIMIYTFDLQLPNLRGQACESMGKSSRCMGHSAWMVNLRTEPDFNTQGCFVDTNHKASFWILPVCLRGNWVEQRGCMISSTSGNEHSADCQRREIHLQSLPELILWVWAVRSAPDANREMVLIIALIHV